MAGINAWGTLANYANDLDKFIELKISEIELADRIVTIIEESLW